MSYDWNKPAVGFESAPKMKTGVHIATVSKVLTAKKADGGSRGESYRDKTTNMRKILVVFVNSAGEEAMDNYLVEAKVPPGATSEQANEATYGATWKLRRHLRATGSLDDAGSAGVSPLDFLTQSVADRWLKGVPVKLVINEKGFIDKLLCETEPIEGQDEQEVTF